MNEADVLELVHRIITVVMLVSAPMVFAAMFTGVIVALIQALTQVQEMTLTFVPKMIAMLIALMLSSTYIGSIIASLSHYVYSRIESGF